MHSHLSWNAAPTSSSGADVASRPLVPRIHHCRPSHHHLHTICFDSHPEEKLEIGRMRSGRILSKTVVTSLTVRFFNSTNQDAYLTVEMHEIEPTACVRKAHYN